MSENAVIENTVSRKDVEDVIADLRKWGGWYGPKTKWAWDKAADQLEREVLKK